MSKGSPIVPIRIPAELLARVEKQIADSNVVRIGEPWTRTAFILTAIEEKLAKMARSRRSPNRPSKAPCPTQNDPLPGS